MPYDGIDKKNYFTISAHGVTHYSNEMVFTKLPSWEQEYTIFVKLTDVSIKLIDTILKLNNLNSIANYY